MQRLEGGTTPIGVVRRQRVKGHFDYHSVLKHQELVAQ